MKIKAVKSGKFAHPEPCKGLISVREGLEYDVDDRMWESMVEDGWGEPVQDAPATQNGFRLDKMPKSELIAFAADHDLGMDETMTNRDMVAFIATAMRAKNG